MAGVLLLWTWVIAERVAQWRHWRVGPFWGAVLLFPRRRGESCLGCGTSYRFVLGHPIRLKGETVETALAIFPLCARCYSEASQHERLLAAGMLLNIWKREGVYGDGDTFARDEWDADRTNVYMEIMAGL